MSRNKQELTPLQRIEEIVLSESIIPDYHYFQSRQNRINLNKSNPGAFLSKSSNGTPTFAIRNQFGGVSYTMLKRGLVAAKTRLSLTNDEKYLEIIKTIEEEMRNMETKISKVPSMYKPDTGLVDTITRYGSGGNIYSKVGE